MALFNPLSVNNHLLSFVFFLFSLCYLKEAHVYGIRVDKPYHEVPVKSLEPNPNCTQSTTSSTLGSKKLQVTYRYGPCSPIGHGRKVPNLAKIFSLDKRRVDSINGKTSNLYHTQDSRLMVPVHNSTGSSTYVVTVGFGTPKHNYTLIFDTGSDTTWMQCKPCPGPNCYKQDEQMFDPSQSTSYHNGSCKSNHGSTYDAKYGDGSYSKGFLGCDTLTLDSDVISNFEFGCGRENSDGFGAAAGILERGSSAAQPGSPTRQPPQNDVVLGVLCFLFSFFFFLFFFFVLAGGLQRRARRRLAVEGGGRRLRARRRSSQLVASPSQLASSPRRRSAAAAPPLPPPPLHRRRLLRLLLLLPQWLWPPPVRPSSSSLPLPLLPPPSLPPSLSLCVFFSENFPPKTTSFWGAAGTAAGNRGRESGLGILGLGRGELSLISQTASKFGKSFGYCLPTPQNPNSGYLLFGKHAKSSSSSLKFTPLQNPAKYPSFYFVKLVDITVGTKRLNMSPLLASSPGTVVDSGTIITRLPQPVYVALRSAFQKSMSKYPLAPPVEILDTCYDLSQYQKVTYPNILFHFEGGTDVSLDQSGIMSGNKSSFCLAFAAKDMTSDFTIIGSTQQQALNVFYDLKGGKIGFGTKGCHN